MSEAFHLTYADDTFPAHWSHINGETLQTDLTLEADVVIIGSGAGGGISAETLVDAGLRVIMVEEGPLRTAKDFQMREDRAYSDLYQEAAARKTRDKGISILQGRSVGGSTTVNWTSSFRTPSPTLDFWAREFATQGHARAQLDPYFDWVEERLGMAPWAVEPNLNNAKLAAGCERLGWQFNVIARNVRGCANLGYCGMGCPMNAKQSMLITTIPSALSRGATLLSRVRVDRLLHDGKTVTQAYASTRDAYGEHKPCPRIRLKARHFVLAAGAIGSPALLLRSQAPDPHLRIGKRTFLHPVVISSALFAEEINAWYGAPQSIYSDEFAFKDGVAGPCGYKLEVPPIHPLLASTLFLQHGEMHQRYMQQLPHLQAVIALMRDGFHGLSEGGQVLLDSHGDPQLDYQINDYLWDGMRRSLLNMAQLQFAAGAETVMPLHKDAPLYSSWAQAKDGIARLPMQLHRQQVVSAHVMGGCAFGEAEHLTVCDSHGRVRGWDNVSVHDGSLFPTSLGVNPQLSIYALTRKLSLTLAQALS